MPTTLRRARLAGESSGLFNLSYSRRSRLRSTLRKFEEQSEALGKSHPSLFPGLSLQFWLPIFFLPIVLCFLALHSIIRVIGSAVRWVVIWTGGFFAGGILAWIANELFGVGYSAPIVWASGGFLGIVALSSFYGMCLEWVFWLTRHENNPYVGTVSLSPQQEADRVAFAKSLHWPTALASAAGAAVFAIALFPIIGRVQMVWPSVLTWTCLGALGLGLQGAILGLYLGWKRPRVIFEASKNSLGEYIGYHLAQKQHGRRASLAWGLGYAIHQFPCGLLVGTVLGGLTNLLFL